MIVRKGEKVTVDIAIHVEGAPVSGTMVQLEHNTISVEAEATHIPDSVSVSVEGLDEGAQIHASDLVLPAGTALLSPPEMLILLIQQPPKVEEEASASEGEEAGDPGAEAEASSDDGGE